METRAWQNLFMKILVTGAAGFIGFHLSHRLIEEGFEVIAVKKGLGELDSFADIYVHHAADAAADADITLK